MNVKIVGGVGFLGVLVLVFLEWGGDFFWGVVKSIRDGSCGERY